MYPRLGLDIERWYYVILATESIRWLCLFKLRLIPVMRIKIEYVTHVPPTHLPQDRPLPTRTSISSASLLDRTVVTRLPFHPTSLIPRCSPVLPTAITSKRAYNQVNIQPTQSAQHLRIAALEMDVYDCIIKGEVRTSIKDVRRSDELLNLSGALILSFLPFMLTLCLGVDKVSYSSVCIARGSINWQ